MTARIVLSCDGHRHGQPCRGALHTRWRAEHRALAQAAGAGWRDIAPDGRRLDLCPSRGHDEDDDGHG